MEYRLQLELMDPTGWMDNFLQENNFARWEAPPRMHGDLPSWFTPGATMTIHAIADEWSTTAVCFKDSLTGRVLYFEEQL